MSKYDSHLLNKGDLNLDRFIKDNKNIFYIVVVLKGFFEENGKVYFQYTVFPERGFKNACVITHLIEGLISLENDDEVKFLLNQIFLRSGIKTFIANVFLDGKNADKDFVLIFMDRTRTNQNVCSKIIHILNLKHIDRNLNFSHFVAGSLEEVAISIPTDCFNSVATISDIFSV